MHITWSREGLQCFINACIIKDSDIIRSHVRQAAQCVMQHGCALVCMSEAMNTVMGSRVADFESY